MIDTNIDFIIEGDTIDLVTDFGQTVTEIKSPETYTGQTTVTPSTTQQILQTKNKLVLQDVTVLPAPEPDLRPLSVSENGQYSPDGFDGYSDVTVDVEPSLTSLSVTENGLYLPDTGVDGFDRVSVDVPTPAPVTESLSVTENGTYVPSAGVDGFDEVIVDVPTGGEIEWDGIVYPVTDESDQYYADHVFNAVYIPNLYAGDTVIIEALGRGVLFAFRGGQPTSGYMQEYKIGSRTDRNILVRFTLNITANARRFIIGGYQWSAEGSHSGYDYYCAYGEYIKYKVIHAS